VREISPGSLYNLFLRIEFETAAPLRKHAVPVFFELIACRCGYFFFFGVFARMLDTSSLTRELASWPSPRSSPIHAADLKLQSGLISQEEYDAIVRSHELAAELLSADISAVERHNGWLSLRGQLGPLMKMWYKRYFVLFDEQLNSSLQHFSSDDRLMRKGTIMLSDISEIQIEIGGRFNLVSVLWLY